MTDDRMDVLSAVEALEPRCVECGGILDPSRVAGHEPGCALGIGAYNDYP